MQISVVRPYELGQNEIAAWRSMQRKTAWMASPFLCPEFTLAVDGFRQGARVAVLSDGPELAGFSLSSGAGSASACRSPLA